MNILADIIFTGAISLVISLVISPSMNLDLNILQFRSYNTSNIIFIVIVIESILSFKWAEDHIKNIMSSTGFGNFTSDMPSRIANILPGLVCGAIPVLLTSRIIFPFKNENLAIFVVLFSLLLGLVTVIRLGDRIIYAFIGKNADYTIEK